MARHHTRSWQRDSQISFRDAALARTGQRHVLLEAARVCTGPSDAARGDRQQRDSLNRPNARLQWACWIRVSGLSR